MHPRGENAAAAWAMTVAGHWAGLARGVAGAAASAALYVHLALAVFPRPPVAPVLDAALAALDGAVPLLGTAAFGGLCFHLLAATVAGCAAVGGVGFGVLPSHPLRRGATHASSLLFNGGLVLLAAAACVQFAAAAFAGYAGRTAASDAWGGTLVFLRGIRVLYQRAVFMYAMAGVSGVTLLVLPCRGAALARARRRDREEGAGVRT